MVSQMHPFLFFLLLLFSFSSADPPTAPAPCPNVVREGGCIDTKNCVDNKNTGDIIYNDAWCDKKNFHLEVRESAGPFHIVKLNANQKGELECKEGTLRGRTENGLLLGDIVRIRCAKLKCSVNSKPFNDKCNREHKCVAAELKDDGYKCPDINYALELQKGDNAPWEEVESQTCIGPVGTATVKGKPEEIQLDSAMLRCRKEALCDVDINAIDGSAVCPGTDKCIEITKTPDNRIILCGDKYNIEYGTDNTKAWNIAESIECFNDKIYEKTNLLGDIKLRCHKKKPCTMDDYFTPTTCDDALTCKKPDSISYACEPPFKLQYSAVSPSPDWKPADSIICNEQFRVQLSGETSSVVPLELRCYIDHGCDINTHSDVTTGCAGDNECAAPTDDNNNGMKCEADYELQAFKDGAWMGVQSISCHKTRAFKYTDKDGTTEGILEKARCVRKNNQFDHTDGCASEEECEKPTEYAPMKCTDKFQLQVKQTAAADWDWVNSIFANSHEFVVKKKDDTEIRAIVGIRCVRKKCSTCSDPCTSSPCPPAQFHAGEWDKCASFGCGAGSRTTIGTQSFTQDLQCHPDTTATRSIWKQPDEATFEITEEVKCEKLCTLSQPQVTSSCESDDVCKQIELKDDEEHTCSERMARKSNPTEKGKKLVCDKTAGEWKLTIIAEDNSEKEVGVDPSDNIYCAFEACDISSLCPKCKPDDKSPKDFRCPPGKEVARIQQRASGDVKDHKSASFSCVHGTWMHEGSTMQSTDSVECLSPAEAAGQKLGTGGSKAGAIVAVFIVCLLILVILILYVFCKLKGNGWLHVIIMDKIRGKKKKTGKGKKEKTSRKGSPMGSQKGDSFSSGKPMTTEKEAGTPDQNQSAEGVSQTGVSCEKMSTEQTGGSPSPTPNEPVEASPTQVIA